MKEGYVYCFSCEGIYYKIGVSQSDPFSRLSSLQTGNPFEIRFVWCVYVSDRYMVESVIHSYFDDKRVRGEWFELTDTDVRLANKFALAEISDSRESEIDDEQEYDEAVEEKQVKEELTEEQLQEKHREETKSRMLSMFAFEIFNELLDFGHISSRSRHEIKDGNLVIKDLSMSKEIMINDIEYLYFQKYDPKDVCLMIFTRI
jgi:hypothetical protein